jgi:signal transduction histidine kinase/ligand-binding sensor domain-containing protein
MCSGFDTFEPLFRVNGAMEKLRTNALLALALMLGPAAPYPLLALDPHKSLTLYSRTTWTQANGLPEETITRIAQTRDGLLWLGTHEGLVRFDGYEFVAFTAENSRLPNNSVNALLAGPDGALWIGTPAGLTRFQNDSFRTFTVADGLPSNSIISLFEDRKGVLWIVAGVFLANFQDGRFTVYPMKSVAPLTLVRSVREDREGHLEVTGGGGLLRRDGDRFQVILGPENMRGLIPNIMLCDSRGEIWLGGNKGIIHLKRDGRIESFVSGEGLPTDAVGDMIEDRDGNIWVGTNVGLLRFENGTFVSLPKDSLGTTSSIGAILEDREKNLWVGKNVGLDRLRDDQFVTYGLPEGLPSNEPSIVYAARNGRVWMGFRDRGLYLFAGGTRPSHTILEGLPSNNILSIRETRNGDLLVATTGGLTRLHEGRLTNYYVPDSLNRTQVYDMLEDSRGRVVVANASGVWLWGNDKPRLLLPGGPLTNDVPLVLLEGHDGTLWAGTHGNGLWRIPSPYANSAEARLYTVKDGLGSNQIRALIEDAGGTLWISTFGGGLNSFRNGVFHRYTSREGLLSNNVANTLDDNNGSLWLSTTRGICRIRKQDLTDFDERRTSQMAVVNYGVSDGLRSSQCAAGFINRAQAARTADGRLWFPTSLGVAVFDPNQHIVRSLQGALRITDLVSDGKRFALNQPIRLQPAANYVTFRYLSIYLRSPESVKYEYTLQNLDTTWVAAGSIRSVTYNRLPRGHYTFRVRGIAPGQSPAEASLSFEVLPHFYETAWFWAVCAGTLMALGYAAYRGRIRGLRSRFSLILQERARLAREIHDTLAQGFVGILSQLDAVADTLDGDLNGAREQLDFARKMTRHSLNEARRAVLNLRACAVDDQDLPTALQVAVRGCVGRSAVEVNFDVGAVNCKLESELQRNLVRITQEAVVNAVKHAQAHAIGISVLADSHRVRLRVTDDGCGFEVPDSFNPNRGHFGLVGMQERAHRIGGRLTISSTPGHGTDVEIEAPVK